MPENDLKQLDLEYDERQYSLMLQKISAFERGDLYLVHLIGDLNGLLDVLTGHDLEWQQTFTGYWWDLEQVYAVAMDEDRSHFDRDDQKIISEALEGLKTIIHEKLKQTHV